VGPLLLNTGPTFIDEATGILVFIWASFDGTTNDPIVYPNSRTIRDLENQVLMQIATVTLPSASVGVDFTTQLAGNGGTLPYTWTLAPGSPGLPAGLGLTTDGVISGTPAGPGTFDFVIRLTDAAGRFVDRPMSITINP
jgi:hypothetical protein